MKGRTASMEQILMIEDDKGLSQGLCKALKMDNRQIISCGNLKSGREQLLCQTPDLILLDLNLPDGNGLTLLREMRAQSDKPPIILLTANDTDEDVVTGLEQGADDYITKPFSLAVLRARVNTQLRKGKETAAESAVQMGLYLFDFVHQRFCVGDTPVELSKTEQKLLRLLVENRGRTMERAVLIDRIWTDGAEYVDENALSVTVKRLRDKLNAQDKIKTVYGIGYQWVNDHE
jgi:DNA-binding response OmpR family regulator